MVTDVTRPTYKRQRFLLSFIRQLESSVTSTELQKLVFLCSMKENLDYYEFMPYKYGPYSFQLADDIDILRSSSFLSQESSHIQAIGDYQRQFLFSIPSERGDNLIRKVYREYPYYAINSIITDRLFSSSEREPYKHLRQGFQQTEQILFTIGYEGRTVEAFVNMLINNDIRLLCDVRKNPISRKFGFSKNRLSHILNMAGIQYAHFPELGIESDKRISLNTIEDYHTLFRNYEEELPTYKPQLDRLYSLLCTNTRIALMCFEKEPEMCHRHVIRGYLTHNYMLRSVDL